MFDGGLKLSGIRGISNGGSCDKLPVAFTVVFSNVILTLEDPMQKVGALLSKSEHSAINKNNARDAHVNSNDGILELLTYEFKFVG